MLAWAYILSARWAELIPGANPPSYSSNCAQLNAGNESKAPDENCDSLVVDVGDVDDDAARWWTAVLAADGGWEASIYNNNRILLYAPWSTRTQPGPTFVVSANVQHHSYVTNHHPRRSAPPSATYQSIALFIASSTNAKQPSQRRYSFQWQSSRIGESSYLSLDYHKRQHAGGKEPKRFRPGAGKSASWIDFSH